MTSTPAQPEQPRPAVGYVRVSTAHQAQHGASLEAQRARIADWCRLASREPVAIYADEGVSGGIDTRPGLAQALDHACRLRAPLVAYSLSRVSRSTRHLLSITERLREAGADIVSLSESIDTTTASGRMVFGILAVLAEFERETVGERTRAVKAHQRAIGSRWCSVAPFGFDWRGGKLARNEAEHPVLQTIANLRGSGLGYLRIADRLNADGHQCRGKAWNPIRVRAAIERGLPWLSKP